MRPLSIVRRRAFALALLIALTGSLALAGAAFADLLTPESGGSANADEIDSLYKLVLILAAIVFIGVEGTLLYSLIRFRSSKSLVPAQIRGNTPLEIGWTVGAALILVVLTVVTFLKLDEIQDPAKSGANGLPLASTMLVASTEKPVPQGGGKALEISVVGRQYSWRYTYPNGSYAYEEMVVPLDTTVILKIQATDVVHSWWIPEMGGKMDAVPGYTNWAWFKPAKEGVFYGQCAELCGRNHANMTARVRVVSPEEYIAYTERLKRDIAAANKANVLATRVLENAGSGDAQGDGDEPGTEPTDVGDTQTSEAGEGEPPTGE